mmetsp:Transcript_7799/g.16524  ORF Transcript_7799/g.16524 Transcript_7799/m.16524 type:complete len:240 (-) Transcript_7799:90-809(-)
MTWRVGSCPSSIARSESSSRTPPGVSPPSSGSNPKLATTSSMGQRRAETCWTTPMPVSSSCLSVLSPSTSTVEGTSGFTSPSSSAETAGIFSPSSSFGTQKHDRSGHLTEFFVNHWSMQGLQYMCSHGKRRSSTPSSSSENDSKQMRQRASPRSFLSTVALPCSHPSALSPPASVDNATTRTSNSDTFDTSMVFFSLLESSWSSRSKSSGRMSSPSMMRTRRSYIAPSSTPSSTADSTR